MKINITLQNSYKSDSVVTITPSIFACMTGVGFWWLVWMISIDWSNDD